MDPNILPTGSRGFLKNPEPINIGCVTLDPVQADRRKPTDDSYDDLNLKALLADLARRHPVYLHHFRSANPGSYMSGLGPEPACFNVPPSSPPTMDMEEDPSPPIQVKEPRSKTTTGPSAPPTKVKEPRSKTAPGPSAHAPPKPNYKPSAMPTPMPTLVEEPHSETSPASSESDNFITVQPKSQKRKLKASKSHANPPKKVGIDVPSTSSRSNPSVSQAIPEEESEDSPMEEPRREKVPPLYIREKLQWQRILPLLISNNVSFETARSTAVGIRVDCPTSDDHRRLTTILRNENVGYHTYALPDERVLRVVIRGLPRELDTELIKADLLSQELPVLQVHRMYHPRTKNPYEMVLVTLELTPEGKRINKITSVCRLSGLRVEPPNNRGRMGQCHRCQLYGHSARNCFARPRCVKCLGDHGTTDCARKQPTEEPPSCVLCGSQGHPASYRGCPKAPRDQKRKVSPAGSNPSAATQPANPTQEFVPAPAPATNAWDKPLKRANKPAPKTTQATAASSAKPAPAATSMPAPSSSSTNSTASDRLADNLNYIELVLSTIDVEEVDAYVRASREDPLKALKTHWGLLQSIKKLKTLNG